MDRCQIRGAGLSPATGAAILLPARETYSPDAAGAIALLVHRLAQPGDLVLTAASPYPPFTHPRVAAITPGLWPLGRTEDRFARAALPALRAARPALIEIHNRPRTAMRIARAFPGLPIALHLHNDPQTTKGSKTPAERAALIARLHIVAVSAFIAGRFADGVVIPPGRLHVLHNCLDLGALPPAPPAAARDQLILFAGRPLQDKGIDSFIDALTDALPSLPGWRAEILGASHLRPNAPPTPFWRQHIPRAQKAGISIAGYVTHHEVLARMRRAAIVVVPSRWAEPFGLTALEAMASGAALITTQRGALPDIAGDAAIYIDPDDPADLAQAILALAHDDTARARLAALGLVRAAAFDARAARTQLAAIRAAMRAAP